MHRLTLNKPAIARGFSQAAPHYDEWAGVQRQLAEGLVHRIPPSLSPASIVDLGCGTGLLSRLLMDLYPAAHLIGVDLAEGMIEVCRTRWAGDARAEFHVADVDQGPPAGWVPDLVACNCSAQWFEGGEVTLTRWARILAPGGVWACTLLLEGSFEELVEAYPEATGRRFPGLRLPSAEMGRRLAHAAGLKVRVCEEERLMPHYPRALDALRYFHGIGAIPRHGEAVSVLSPALTRRLLQCYEEGANAQGEVVVTHRVQYLVAERP
jgi:malonyl-CoA O-methyltransferase